MEEDRFYSEWPGWCAPKEILWEAPLKNLDNITRSIGVTGGACLPQGVYALLTHLKEEKMDKAVELLVTTRQAEAEAREYEKAQAIVAAVTALNIAEIPDGIAVRFTKRFGRETAPNYVYLAQRVLTPAGNGWYVTGRQGIQSDLEFESLLARDGGFEDFIVVYGVVSVAEEHETSLARTKYDDTDGSDVDR